MLLDISRYAATTLQLQCSYMWVIANDPLSTLLPLRHALKDNAPLGSIDLLIKGNISASAMRVFNTTAQSHSYSMRVLFSRICSVLEHFRFSELAEQVSD